MSRWKGNSKKPFLQTFLRPETKGEPGVLEGRSVTFPFLVLGLDLGTDTFPTTRRKDFLDDCRSSFVSRLSVSPTPSET